MKYSCEIQVLTPIHIFDREALTNEMIWEGNKIGLVSPEILARKLRDSGSGISYEELMQCSLNEILKQKGIDSTEVVTRWIMAGVQRERPKAVRLQLVSGCPALPCVPGSSLKGFIRTAIMSELPYVKQVDITRLKREYSALTKRYHSKKQVMTKMATFIDDEARILRFPWNTHTLNRDAFRGLIVGDAYQVDTQSATRLEKVAVVSPRGGGNPQSNRSVIAEVLSPGTVFKARIVLNDQIKPLLDKLNLGTGIETVLKCANRHSMRILSSDIAFFERFNKDCKFAGIIARLKELTKQVQEDQTNYALVRLGLGGGYVARSVGAVVDKAVTGWVAENFYKDKASPDYFPRSRRVTTEWERPKNIMGWAKLTIIDKE